MSLSIPAAPPAGSTSPLRRPEPRARIRDGFPGQRMTGLPASVLQRARTLPLVSDLFVVQAGHFPAARSHYVARPAGIQDLVLIYCVGGAGWCEMAGTEWRVPEGWALFVTPDTPHVYMADVDDPWSIWWVHVAGRRLSTYLRVLGVSPEQPLLYVPDSHRVGEAFRQIYAHTDEAYSDGVLLGMSTALAALLGLLKRLQRAPGTHARSSEESVYRSIEFMREHLGEMHRLPDLASIAGMSVPHYASLFKRLTNSSPIHFLIQLRVKRACELLDTTPDTVAAIAARVGYHDAFHFSRVFKQVVGKSPTQYREATKG